MATETFTERSLTIELTIDDSVNVTWLGKSTAREPAQFVLPILSKALAMAGREQKSVVIDFRQLEYMNSSTITPLIRVLEQAKGGNTDLRVLYRKDLKWQALSFTALEVFHTDDKRIEIRGV